MKISAKKLFKHTSRALSTLNIGGLMPILDNLLFEFDNGKLKITGTDLQTTLSTTFDCEGEGSYAVPAKIFNDTLKSLGNQDIELIFKDNNTLLITAQSGKYKVAWVSGSEYPKNNPAEYSESVEMKGHTVDNMIDKVLFAISDDAMRPTMSGICVDFQEDKTVFVATDANKLSRITFDRPNKTVGKIIIPKKPLTLLRSIEKDAVVVMKYNEANVKFTIGDVEIYGTLIDGTYPAYESIIPKNNDKRFSVGKEIISAVKRVSMFANKGSRMIRLDIDQGNLKISSEDLDYSNAADETIPCSFNSTQPFAIGLNSSFLLEMFDGNDGYEFSMSEPTKPLLIHYKDSPNLTRLVAPLRLD